MEFQNPFCEFNPDLTPEVLRREYESGLTHKQLADKYGCHRNTISKLMSKAGVKPRLFVGNRTNHPVKPSEHRLARKEYSNDHKRVESVRGKPKKCEVCGKDDPAKRYDWANLTGRYADPFDYKRMCRSCHWKHDHAHKFEAVQ